MLSYARGLVPGLSAEELVAEWLQGTARVRPRLHRWEILATIARGLGDVELALRPVQVPYRAKDRWLAVSIPAQDPIDPTQPFGVSRDTLSIAAHGPSAFSPGVRQCGLLIDEWTEEIPSAQEITGIAFRYNQPNAAPPQTLLLAVTPVESGAWSWDALVGTLVDTMRRAKQRAVEPAQLEAQGTVWNAFAPALVSEFSTTARADVSLDLLGVVGLSDLRDFMTAATVR